MQFNDEVHDDCVVQTSGQWVGFDNVQGCNRASHVQNLVTNRQPECLCCPLHLFGMVLGVHVVIEPGILHIAAISRSERAVAKLFEYSSA